MKYSLNNNIVKISKREWESIGKIAGWIKESDHQLDFFQETPEENQTKKKNKPEHNKEKKTNTPPELINAWREATGSYGVLFMTSNGKYYFYSLGFKDGKTPLDNQKLIVSLSKNEATKQKALRVAELSANWAAETDRNGMFIREIDLNRIR